MVKRNVILLFLMLASSQVGHAKALHPKLQVAILRKILRYNAKLKPKMKQLTILVVHSGNAGNYLQLFKNASINPRAVSVSEGAASLQGIDLVYFLPKSYSASVASKALAAGVLTVSGDSNIAEEGKASVGLGVANNRPLIVVNLKRLARENHEFSSQLLALAKVVK